MILQLLLIKDIPKNSDLSVYHFPARSSNGFTPLDTSLKVEDIANVVRKILIKILVILERQLVQLAFTRLGQRNCLTRYMMSFSEWDLLSRNQRQTSKRGKLHHILLSSRGNQRGLLQGHPLSVPVAFFPHEPV